MKIVVVNVNTSETVTEAIGAQARAVASPGTEVLAVTPFFGPESVEGNFESYLSAVAVMDRIVAIDEPFDAVVQAGFGEHGKEGLAELLEVPVIDITEAAAHVACLLGHRHSVVTSLDRAVPQISDRLTLTGLHTRCASVRATGMPVLELESDPAKAQRRIVEEASAAIANDGAEVICLGCAGMSGLAEKITAATSAPVVDGVSAAVGLAETLVRSGLRTSKIGGYATPRSKRLTGWPITER
jgi:allantoin racemase